MYISSGRASALVSCLALLAGSMFGTLPARAQPVTFISGPWPPYASDALSIYPEPTGAGVPTEIRAHLYNADTSPHDVTVQFLRAALGIAPDFVPIGGAQAVTVPALSEYDVIIYWVPPSIGPWSYQARLSINGYEDQVAERSIDALEPLEPLAPHPLDFIVRNPSGATATVSIGLIPHLADWGLELSQDVFPGLPPGGYDLCTLTTTPPADLPDGGAPIVDVEGFIGGELIGGFRKIFPVSHWCPGTRLDLYADAARINTPSSSEERGAYITAIRHFSLCAVGMEIDLDGPQAILASVYEADGTTRGALLAYGVEVEALPGKRMHFIPVDCVLEECRDYDIAVSFGPVIGWDYFDEYTFPEPFDVNGIIRVRDGECAGDASNFVLPCLSLIGSPIECPRFTDLSPPEVAWSACTDASASRGVYVTARRTVSVCALGWEADISSVPAELVCRVYEASGTVRGDLVGSAVKVVTSTGMQMHMVPLGVLLKEGKDYDFSVEFPPSTWACADESGIGLPFAGEDVLAVRDGEVGGDAGSPTLGHFSIEWSDAAGGTRFDLAKHGDEYPPPFTSTQTGIDYGIYVTSLADQQIYSIGWRADVPAGAAIGARVYAAAGTVRGALLSEGYIESSEDGMRWHDIPLSASLEVNGDYDLEIDIGLVNEWRWWNDGAGLPYESYGAVRVVDGECQGNPLNAALIELRMWACGEELTGVDEDAGKVPPFRMELVYPNPAADRFFVEYDLAAPGPVSAEVYDVAGRRIAVLHRTEYQAAGPGRLELESKALSPGTYFLRLNAPSGSVSRKFVVVR